MPFSHDDVRGLARLARIGLTDAEVTQFAGELSAIVAYVDRLQEVDVSSIDDRPVFLEAQSSRRDVSKHDVDTRERLIQQFPDRLGEALRVPAVFAERTKTV